MRLGDDVKETLAVKAHKSSTSVMLQIKDSLLELPRESSVPRSVRMYLLYAGVAVRRTRCVNSTRSTKATCALLVLFVLQILVHQASIAAVSAAEPTRQRVTTRAPRWRWTSPNDADVSTPCGCDRDATGWISNTSETIDVLEQWKRATLEASWTTRARGRSTPPTSARNACVLERSAARR